MGCYNGGGGGLLYTVHVQKMYASCVHAYIYITGNGHHCIFLCFAFGCRRTFMPKRRKAS